MVIWVSTVGMALADDAEKVASANKIVGQWDQIVKGGFKFGFDDPDLDYFFRHHPVWETKWDVKKTESLVSPLMLWFKIPLDENDGSPVDSYYFIEGFYTMVDGRWKIHDIKYNHSYAEARGKSGVSILLFDTSNADIKRLLTGGGL